MTLDFYFCGKKTKRDDLDDEDILECFEKAKEEKENEEQMKKMELIWEDFEEEFLEEMAQRDYFCNGQAVKDYMEELDRKTPTKVELTPIEREDRQWKVNQIDWVLPQNFTYSYWYWDASEDMKMQKRIKGELDNPRYLK